MTLSSKNHQIILDYCTQNNISDHWLKEWGQTRPTLYSLLKWLDTNKETVKIEINDLDFSGIQEMDFLNKFFENQIKPKL